MIGWSSRTLPRSPAAALAVLLAVACSPEPSPPGPVVTLLDTWSFAPGAEAPADTELDLRFLNETRAGERGFVRRSTDGAGFVRGDGQPLRFWGVGSSVHKKSPDEMERHARFLARRGVNLVRIHTSITPKGEGARIEDVDAAKIERIQRFVATLARHGIYSMISPYWAHPGSLGRERREWTLEGYEDPEQGLWGLLFFNPELQRAYRGWLRALLAGPNPHGPPLCREPALAILQVHNEDSLLFWTFDAIAEPQRRLLRRRFAAWLEHEHGSLERALAAWEGESHERDDPARGEMGLASLRVLTRPDGPGGGRRFSDQTRFLAELQRDFYADTTRYVREELGCRQLVNASNWKSADPELLDDLERWTYTAAEVMARNRYLGARHYGPHRKYRIDPGDVIQHRTALRDPALLPVNVKQPVGYPFVITESSWGDPNLYQTEGPLLASALGSLVGLDGFVWSGTWDVGWMEDPRKLSWEVGDSYGLRKWSIATPQALGQFPATALAFRRGYVETAAEPSVLEVRPLEAMWARHRPLISETQSFDPNRDREEDLAPVGELTADRRAFLVAPVQVRFGGDPAASRIAPLERFVDAGTRVIRSATGQIHWDYGAGVVRVDAPRFQAVSGFLAEAGGRFSLSTLGLETRNRYATIIAVSLDHAPLARSSRVLVQVGTLVRPLGWTTERGEFDVGEGRHVEGERILTTGGPPLQIAATAATLSLANPHLSRATALHPNGTAQRELDVETTETGIRLALPRDALYVLLR